MVAEKGYGDDVDKKTPFARIGVRSGNCTKSAKGGHSKMNGMNGLTHTRWNCKYHIVFTTCYFILFI